MKKSAYSDILVPTGIERENLIIKAFQTLNTIMYEKQDKAYKCYCTWCNTTEVMPYKKLKMVRAAKRCWNCGHEFNNTTKVTKGYHRQFCSYDNINGFIVSFNYDWGKIIDVNIEHYYHYENYYTHYVRKVNKFMYSIVYAPEKESWRRTTAYYDNWYHACEPYMGTHDTLRRSYEDFVKRFGGFKSNQFKFITQGVYNDEQLLAIKCFDLNRPEEVERNNKYIKNKMASLIRMVSENMTLNVYFLDYLSREQIPLHDYLDYARGCLVNHEKPQKPKKEYFWKLHDNKIIAKKYADCKQYDEACYERFKELESNVFVKDEYCVMPFKNAYEIVATGQILHNCIGTYVNRYANKITDIYYCKKNDSTVIAIEVTNGKIIQARSDHNGTPEEAEMKFLKTWAKEKNILWKN